MGAPWLGSGNARCIHRKNAGSKFTLGPERIKPFSADDISASTGLRGDIYAVSGGKQRIGGNDHNKDSRNLQAASHRIGPRDTIPSISLSQY